MIPRLLDSLVLRPADIEPSQVGWEVVGVFNPAVAVVDNEIVMLARIAERPAERRPGWTPLPYWSQAGVASVNWVRDEDVLATDARVVALKSGGDLRLTSVSHLQIFRWPLSSVLPPSTGPPPQAIADAVSAKSVIFPEQPYEEYGIEDARITKIEATYWITYVAVSRFGAATALMSSTDLVKFQRHGIIFPSENKDVVFFPEKIAGDYVALHRPNPNSHFSPPQIWIARSPDLVHWGSHEPIVRGVRRWESDRVGSGTPPILTNQGWLMLYHGSATSNTKGTVGSYATGAVMLDREEPNRVIARTREPIMCPTTPYETDGFVPNVVFPTAWIDLGEELQVFYGAADTSVAMTRFSKRSILDSLSTQSDFLT